MKKFFVILFSVVLFFGCDSSQTETSSNSATEGQPETSLTDQSYAVGVDISKGFIEMGVEVDIKQLSAGLVDGFNNKSRFSEQEVRDFVDQFRFMAMQKQEEKRRQDGVVNLQQSEEFLASNKTKSGVVTTESGLQYKILQQGSGSSPSATNTVKVHYRGELLNGDVFDSSYERNEPIEFQADRVIPGWTEALQLMNAGSKWVLYIPPSLAYGEQGAAGGRIGPNQALIFELELISFK